MNVVGVLFLERMMLQMFYDPSNGLHPLHPHQMPYPNMNGMSIPPPAPMGLDNRFPSHLHLL
ncbi:BEM_HP_G0079010.mRNA.1.CDS.1 [Saccharomyces cerevisiae]|nr:BEM_HP_G0079010.mRNA.1.CDS.1 [Saccharomyces cerevisiae]CAI6990960.1 BEM_HP_G0079010.mRNA.1.CDS.1 [Saccharomyces cerevisiae]